MSGEAGMDCPDNCPTCDPTPEPSEVAETTAGERGVCWLNEDCIAGRHMDEIECRFPSWTDDAAEPDAGEVEALAKLLAEHDGWSQVGPRDNEGRFDLICFGCGDLLFPGIPDAFGEARMDELQRAHVATVLASPWLAAHVSAAETKARADERERIANAIEARKVHVDNTESACPDGCGWLNFAARIARGDAR